MKMIVGLGNPGSRYEQNRHNIGFQIVDELAAAHGLSFDKRQHKAKIASGWIGEQRRNNPPPTSPRNLGEAMLPPAGGGIEVGGNGWSQRVLLVKPQTFMNLSGEAVQPLAAYYKIDPADIIVILDDLDLPTGKLRLRPFGGAGGHNGMKSIIQRLGTNQFPRLRVGIDRPPGRMDPAAYVLHDFSSDEEEIMVQVRNRARQALERWLEAGIDAAMNKFNENSR